LNTFFPLDIPGTFSRAVIQKFCAVLGIGFCAYMFLTVSVRSGERTSILSTDQAFVDAEGYFKGMVEPEPGGSKLHLQEFHRIAVKNGKPVWEIRADDAQYYSKEGVTYLNNAKLIVYRDKDSRVHLQAKSAKLHMIDKSLSKAELVGNIVVSWDGGFTVRTELALYDVTNEEITAPEHVTIQGSGYLIEGEGLEVRLDSQRFMLARQVNSKFTADAKAPEGELFEALGK